MSMTIEFPSAIEREIRLEAAKEGRAPEDFVRTVLEERLRASREQQTARNQDAIALLRQWRKEEASPEDDEDYPETLEPLRLREVVSE